MGLIETTKAIQRYKNIKKIINNDKELKLQMDSNEQQLEEEKHNLNSLILLLDQEKINDFNILDKEKLEELKKMEVEFSKKIKTLIRKYDPEAKFITVERFIQGPKQDPLILQKSEAEQLLDNFKIIMDQIKNPKSELNQYYNSNYLNEGEEVKKEVDLIFQKAFQIKNQILNKKLSTLKTFIEDKLQFETNIDKIKIYDDILESNHQLKALIEESKMLHDIDVMDDSQKSSYIRDKQLK